MDAKVTRGELTMVNFVCQLRWANNAQIKIISRCVCDGASG